VVEAIHTAVPGRARFKVEGLYRSESLKKVLESRLAQTQGVLLVSANVLTGKVLVSFNSNNTPASITALIEKLIGDSRKNGSAPPSPSVFANGANELALIPSPNGGANAQALVAVTPQALPATTESAERVQPRPVGAFPAPAWHVMETEAVLTTLHSSQTAGLSSVDAQRQWQTYGPNILPEAESRSAWEIVLDQVNSVPVALLTAAAGISVLTGGLADALVIMGVVAINAAIGYVTESRSESTIRSLKTLVRPSALVVRDQQIQEIPAGDVVPGDILVLKPGSYVSADCRLLAVERLTVDESALTGESLPVHKTATPLISADLPLGDRVNMVYMGTLVTGGQGLAVVVATGRATELGQIQLLAGEAQAPETPMERQLDQMGTQLVLISGAVCGLVFGVGLLRGYGFLEMLKTAISLAVAAVPEGLPTVATTTLALGIVNMRKHHVLIRRLEAVETLGCVQAICLDKTGTLTLNRMSAVTTYTGMQRMRIVDDAFLVNGEPINPLACEEFVRLAQVCVLCSEVEIEHYRDQYVLRGSPTENALIHLALSAGIDVQALRGAYAAQTIRLRAENRNFMSALHRATNDNGNDATPPLLLTVKGSPAEVLTMCAWYVKDGNRLPLTDEDRLHIETENERMAGEALRVLGGAYHYMEDDGADREVLEGLTWVGLVGMTDPVRSGVKEVINGFHQASIDTIMITGDQSPTAYAIGKELALSRNGHLEILDSTHLANIDPDVMKALAEKVHVFARVSPAHKLQIVQALQRSGKVVAMTGDGINDGPALKAADIGVAMGHTGTDVAREVADVVLENDNLETMIIGISQGRTIYNNIRKSVHFLLSTNLSEIIVTATAISVGLGQPLNAMQLLWINLISDIFPGLALALEPAELDVMNQPPRNPEEPIIKSSDFRSIALESAALSTGALSAYGYGLLRYGAGPQASTLAFTSLTASQLLHAVTSRSETHSVFDATPLPSNPYLSAALIGSFGLQALALVVPGLRGILGLTPLSVLDGVVISSSAVLPFLANEAAKKLRTAQPSAQREDTE
jgi:Ca2+-transporting ATPase